jgi:hypothetical protein
MQTTWQGCPSIVIQHSFISQAANTINHQLQGMVFWPDNKLIVRVDCYEDYQPLMDNQRSGKCWIICAGWGGVGWGQGLSPGNHPFTHDEYWNDGMLDLVKWADEKVDMFVQGSPLWFQVVAHDGDSPAGRYCVSDM